LSSIVVASKKTLPELLDGLTPGEYFVDYNDSTHLSSDRWIQLLQVTVGEKAPLSIQDEFKLETFFKLKIAIETDVNWYSHITKVDAKEQKKNDDVRVIKDQLALCLGRLGLLSPGMSKNTLSDLLALIKRQSILLVPDTNSLSNGSLHWLLHALQDTSVSIMPVTISLTTIQEKDREIKELVGASNLTNLKKVLRSRTVINSSLELLERCGERYQILGVQPELLRANVIEDRLFVEAVHEVFRSTRSRAQKRFITSDVTFARILHAEAIPTIFLETPVLKDQQELDSIRFDFVAKRFIGCSLREFFECLVSTFSSVRIRTEPQGDLIRIDSYWPGKGLEHWIYRDFMCHVLNCDFFETNSPSPPNVVSVHPQGELTDVTVSKEHSFHFSTLAAPNISLMPVLTLLGIVLQKPAGSKTAIAALTKKDEISSVAANSAAEVLLQASFIDKEGDQIIALSSASEFATVFESGDLDRISALFRQFNPYAVVLDYLAEYGSLPDELNDELKNRMGRISLYAYRNLRPYAIYFGQAWTDSAITMDGSRRPPRALIVEQFPKVFDSQQTAQLASLESIILGISRELRSAPWWIRNEVQALTELGSFPDFRFDPASGGKPKTRDRVVSGTLSNPILSPVVVDRLLLNGRPVFTVVRSPEPHG
jgi:hypothetical protein